MPKKLSVYGWQGMRRGADGTIQTREIVAAHSWAEVQRITGSRMSQLRWAGSETGNAEEIKLAMGEPGVVFWSRYERYPPEWNRVPPTTIPGATRAGGKRRHSTTRIDALVNDINKLVR